MLQELDSSGLAAIAEEDPAKGSGDSMCRYCLEAIVNERTCQIRLDRTWPWTRLLRSIVRAASRSGIGWACCRRNWLKGEHGNQICRHQHAPRV